MTVYYAGKVWWPNKKILTCSVDRRLKKDINGKTLREGDVCVVHPRGELVVFAYISSFDGTIVCDDSKYESEAKSKRTTFPKPEDLEIIGDVR